MAQPFRYVQSGDCRIRAAVEGSGPLVLLVHGWPESWYSWRHQIGPIARAGFTVAAIDVRGYGGSSRPSAVEAYDMASMIGDLQACADQLGRGKAILIGHDWGAPICWNAALVDPKRFTAVAGLSIPHLGQGDRPFIDLARQVFTANGRFFYQVYFQDEGVAEAEMEADVRAGLGKLYYALSGDAPPGAWPSDKRHGDSLLHRLPDPVRLPAWLTERELDYYVSAFRRSGFRGAFNRYRNSERDHVFLADFANRRILQPSLFIAGRTDMALPLFGQNIEARMRQHAPNLKGFHLLDRCGHWTQQEKPAAVTALLLGWLKGLPVHRPAPRTRHQTAPARIAEPALA